MANDYVIPNDELQETALYDIIQYLPLNKVNINENDSINKVIEEIEMNNSLDKSAEKAISENLPTIKKILEDRPELGEARISNMSWQDNNDDGKADYPVEGIQVCTFERAGKGYISFRGTPEASWIDNAEAYGKDSGIAKFSYLNLKIEDYNAPLANPSNVTPADDYEDDLKILKNNTILANPSNATENITYFELPRVYEEVIYKYTSPMQELAISYVQGLKKPTNGEMSIFDRCDEVVAIGHSKGGNEAMLVTMFFPDVIDRCISADGQGFSPELIKNIKKVVGEEKWEEITHKIYRLNARDDYVHPFGEVVSAEGNTMYFAPDIPYSDILGILYNHYPTVITDSKTGDLRPPSEMGVVAKFVERFYEKTKKLSKKDREKTFLTAMALAQAFLGKSMPISINLMEDIKYLDKISKGFGKGMQHVIGIALEIFLEDVGNNFIKYIREDFGGDLRNFIKSYVVSIHETTNRVAESESEQLANNLGGLYKDRYEKYGSSFLDMGITAINYDKMLQLITVIGHADDKAQFIISSMDNIIDDLERLRFWRVNTADIKELRNEIEADKRKRLQLKEKLINYYNSCKGMESKFVSEIRTKGE